MAVVYRIGGATLSSLTGVEGKILGKLVNALNTGAGSALQLPSGTDYAVTAGKTLYLTGMIFASGAGGTYSAGSYFELRYADNAALTTNPVTLGLLPMVEASRPLVFLPFFGTVPAAHYIGIFNASGTNQAAAIGYTYTFVGYEV
jgi:hypothetical protein